MGSAASNTAAQPKHYREDLVGEAVREALSAGLIQKRADVYIQTKFSRPPVQDPLNVPYSLDAPLEEQVHASIKSSLHNLRHDHDDEESSYIDILLLHSPYPTFQDTLRAWQVFSSYVPHRIRALGISNATLSVLEQLYSTADIKPTFVQGRFHPESQFDVPMRRFCADNNMIFRAHKATKGNKELLESQLLSEVAFYVGVSKYVALYVCVLSLPAVEVVNGTKSKEHMKEDIEGLEKFNQWCQGIENQKLWDDFMTRVKILIGE